MKRLHLFEIEDQDWCPRAVRDGATDYLQFVLAALKPYTAIVPVLAAALQRSGTRRVVDLCSGGTGPWLWLRPALAEAGMNVSVCLTDAFPNTEAFEWSSRMTNQAISYYPQPVDARRVPGELLGFRTIFTAFHHFRPEQGCAVLADAVRQRQSIGIFETTQRRGLALLLTLPAPLFVLILTPLIRPFRWSRLFWTYVIPLVPIVTLFDGLVSCLRTYHAEELHALTTQIGTNDYRWEIGQTKNKSIPIPVTYLIGVPLANAGQRSSSPTLKRQSGSHGI